MNDTNKTAYTPGPWGVEDLYVTDLPSNACVVVFAAPKDDEHTSTKVAEAAYSPEGKGYFVTDRAEAEANARLIAAAPELLEALQIALSAIEQTTSEMTVGDRFTNAGQSLLDAFNPCRDAISKATGAPV